MFDPIKFFNLNRMFEMRPYTYPQTIKVMFIFFLTLVIIALAIKVWQIYKKPINYLKKITDKYISFLSWISIFGFIMVLARNERAPFISARFWLIIWFIIALIWLFLIIKYQIKTVPEIKKQIEQKKQFIKYLPKKK